MKRLFTFLFVITLIAVMCAVPAYAENEHQHEYVYVHIGDDFMHRVTCASCDEVFPPEPHKGGESTCTLAAVCVECGGSYGSADGHSGTGTCIEDWYCDICEEYVGGKDPDSHIYGYDVPNATEPDCFNDGYTGDTVCSACGVLITSGEIIPKLSHKFENGVCSLCDTPEAIAPSTPEEIPTSSVPEIYDMGDVNLDGKLNIRDATAIQKHIAKIDLFDETAESLADFDANGTVNVKDATAIQKTLAKL